MKKVIKKSSVKLKKAQTGTTTPSQKAIGEATWKANLKANQAKKEYMKSNPGGSAMDSPKYRASINELNTSLAKLKKQKKGGVIKKAKSGGSFPDLNKDGKVTKADVLVGRGVIKAKKGAALKKQAAVAIAMKKAGKTPKTMKSGGKMKKCAYGCK